MTTIRHTNPKILSAAALAVVIIATTTVIWAIGIGQSSADAPASVTPPQGIALVNGPAAALSAQQQKSIDALRGTLNIDFGELHAAGGGVWIANATAKSCVFVENGEGIGAGCASTASTEAGNLAFNARSTTTDASDIAGVVPDGVRTVTATNADGATVDTATVRNNVYRVNGSELRSLTLRGDSETTQIALAG